ncbi:MAG: hypothetical protein RR668_07205, partial [Algoriella sp.]
ITARLIKTNAYSSLDDSYNALKYVFETYEYIKKEKDIFNEARILGRIGELFQLYGYNTQSRDYLDESVKIITSSSFPKEKRSMYLGNIYGVKGNGYKDDLDCDFALKYYNKAISAYKSAEQNQSVVNNLALVYIEKSNCLIDKQDLDSATYFLNNALSVIKKNNLIEYDQSATISLARIHQSKREFRQANDLLNQVLKDKNLAQELLIQNQIYKLLAQNAFELKDFVTYKKYMDIIKTSNSKIEKINLNALERSFDYLLYKDQTFLDKLSFFKLPIILIVVLLILIFREIYKSNKKIA